MDTKIVRYILCRMLGVEAALLLVPVLVAVIYQEKCGIVFDTNCYIMPAVLGGRKKKTGTWPDLRKGRDGDRCSGMDFVVFIRSNAIHPFRVYT